MKIIYVNYVMDQGGIENFTMNVLKKLNQNNSIEILTFVDPETKFYHEEELKKLNCKIHKIDKKKLGLIGFIKELIKIFKKGKYDIVHSNVYATSGYVMLAAYLSGIKIRVAHSHSSHDSKNIFDFMKHIIGKILIKLFSNRQIACSEKAGNKLFGKNKYIILENGVDLNKYEFNEKSRNYIRNKYNIKHDEKVIGHIGRFHKVKNHKFIIEVFENILKIDHNFKLMLIGDGEEFNNIKHLVKNKGIDSKVIFVGSANNANEYYSSFDSILFPSFYEGMPFVFIEGQINGLNFIASNTISKDSNLIGNITYLDLNENIQLWSTKVIEKSECRHFNHRYFKESNYNLDNMINKMIKIYNGEK